ncbi:MAG TPA: peptide chain release factor N(5)-glutamine methyltransferase [Candidatus Cybelea sp.]|jgi:release factor glutamine methyltransferase|nr:peptide chain release factor N(5)-glutamine methyltransferase [Candidatus Cybelea sp.]
MSSVSDTLAQGTALLRECSEAPRADAMLLLERALGRSRSWIVAYGETELALPDAQTYDRLCERRRTGVPAAYILGSAGFYGNEFLVNESVLVPRPETEHLVDEAREFVGDRALAVLDVGTGSGAIACSIARATPAVVDATDLSAAALVVAGENAARLGVADRCRFHLGDLVEPVAGRRFDVVVANLPYVPRADVPKAPHPVAFEPRVAVDGGADGLCLYRRLLKALPALHPSLVLLEAAPPTIEELAALVRAAFPTSAIEIREDYAGLARYLKVAC